MPTWNDYKKHVQEVNLEAARDMKEAEEYAAIISDMMKRGDFAPYWMMNQQRNSQRKCRFSQ